MSPAQGPRAQASPARDNRLLYAGALVIEVLVLLAIWLFQRRFGS